ncbi:hypothetical protein T08_1477 [Trichinella sp. T8]|nr:hypothetical protein T08_1477 [Trichinella sp. T8]
MRRTGPFPSGLPAATGRSQSDASDDFETTGGEDDGNYQPSARRPSVAKFCYIFFGATSREKESGFGEPDTSQLVIASLQRYIVV